MFILTSVYFYYKSLNELTIDILPTTVYSFFLVCIFSPNWCPQISKGFAPWLDGFFDTLIKFLFYSTSIGTDRDDIKIILKLTNAYSCSNTRKNNNCSVDSDDDFR